MVLWIVVSIGILAAAAISVGRQHTIRVQDAVAQSQARAIAEGGVWLSIFSLFEAAPGLNPTSQRFDIGGGFAQTIIKSERMRVDLNRARVEVLATLLETGAVEAHNSQLLVDAILDWRDPDNIPREFGAERKHYRNAGIMYGPKNGPFNAIEELRLVKGFDEAIYQRLAPMITVFSHSAAIDPQLKATLLNSSIAENEMPPEISATSAERHRRPARSGSNVLRIVSSGNVRGVVSRVTAVVEIDPNGATPYQILAWKEG